jgi:hypothetical protein
MVCPAVVALCLWGTTAQAQIYALRDANGILTLSDKPLGPGAQTYALPGVSGIRTTVPVTKRPTGERRRYDALVEEHAAMHGVRPELVRAVIQVESAFNPRATSPKGAMGLMQLMPGTAADLGIVDAYDPGENIRGGVTYLRSLLDQFGGNEELALAAYNAGPHAVARYGNVVPPYRETRDYVQKVRARTSMSTRPRHVVYRVVEIVDGQPIVRYTNAKPKSGHYEVITQE